VKILSWPRFVDLVTVIWLAIFILSFFASPSTESTLRTTNIAILSVFVVDLGVSYWKVKSPSIFLKKHWLDILMVIPYFRIFRIARILHLIRFVRIAKSIKIIKMVKAVKAMKVSKWVRFRKVSVIMHEIGDLFRTIKSRFIC